MEEKSGFPFPNDLVRTLAPFHFSNINLNIPFTLYTVAAVFLFPGFFVNLGAGLSKSKSRNQGRRGVGVF